MSPVQIELLNMVVGLLFVMIASATVSAYVFREAHGWLVVIGSFVVSIVLIFVSTVITDAFGAFLVSAAFGASLGAMLGSFVTTLTEGHPRAGTAVALTLGIITAIAGIAAAIGLFSGYDFQGIRGTMFIILLGILGISLLGFVIRFGKVMELLISLGVIGFFSVYLVVHFNQIKETLEVATWNEALQIAMSIFLDLVNIFVRLLPIILEMLD